MSLETIPRSLLFTGETVPRRRPISFPPPPPPPDNWLEGTESDPGPRIGHFNRRRADEYVPIYKFPGDWPVILKYIDSPVDPRWCPGLASTIEEATRNPSQGHSLINKTIFETLFKILNENKDKLILESVAVSIANLSSDSRSHALLVPYIDLIKAIADGPDSSKVMQDAADHALRNIFGIE